MMANAKLHYPSSFPSTKSTTTNNNVTLFPSSIRYYSNLVGLSNIRRTSTRLSQRNRIVNNALDNKSHHHHHNTVVVKSKKNDCGGSNNNNKVIVEGTVIVIKKTVLGLFTDLGSSLLHRVDDMVGRKLCFQLVSAHTPDPENEMRGKRSEPVYVKTLIMASDGLNDSSTESGFKVRFELDRDFGVPGALIVRNERLSEFYLKSVSLHGIPNHDHQLRFICNSWVYPAIRYKNQYRVFFPNQAYLPGETPGPLRGYREEELEMLRGNGVGKLEEWDRVYDYAYYNDLGSPDMGPQHGRPVLGGSQDYPYPRRGRTGRPPTKTDEYSESRLPYVMSLDIYVPRDERFGSLKMADYMAYSLKAVSHGLKAALNALLDNARTEFVCLEDTLKLYKHEKKLVDNAPSLEEKTTLDMIKEFFQLHKIPHYLKFPVPHIIKEDKSAWTSDEEFAREMLAGVNPVVIRRLEVFPPVSELDPEQYGDHSSSIREEHIEKNLEGISVDEAMKKKKMFILDHHDALMPYLRRINTTNTKTYATRTLLFLKDDGTLKPLAIELSLPHPDGDELGATSKVYTPADSGVDGSIWQLAKVYVSVNDSGYHQLVCHWLNTHAVIEPFVIASNRQLSVLHPIHRLLCPHFRDTMNINAFARQILIGAGGVLEQTVFPGKYALEMCSAVYKDWVFTDHALPTDLLKRGMAEKDPNSPHGYKLLIEDYPFAVDGLSIWSAIEEWVTTYITFYYKTPDTITNDTELQSWWHELRNQGHGDLKHKPWWPQLTTLDELIQTCTTIIWIASALHAAVNFGQYPYAGYLPNRPTTSRRFMPEPGTPAYNELQSNPESVLLKTITCQWKTLLGVSLIEILSTHTADEVYLGRREDGERVAEEGPVEGFERFRRQLEEIEGEIEERNKSEEMRNRTGPVNMPYTLLMPTSDAGVTARGIPNSISI